MEEKQKEERLKVPTKQLQSMDFIWILSQTNKLMKWKKVHETGEDNWEGGNASWRFDHVKELLLIFLGMTIVS